MSDHRPARLLLPAAAAALALLFGATACGGDDSASSTTAPATSAPSPTAAAGGSGDQAGGVHNSIDVAFAQGMIPHHAQAVEMSELAATNTSNPEVQALATEIVAAQGPEIELMTEWLTAWGAEVPDPEASMAENMEMAGGMMMSGMISESDFEKLRAARDAEFDRLYLELIILHHDGAIEMAQQELDGGDSPEAKELAQQIIDVQQAEITRVEALLGQAG
ncbi:MAG: DUF305 domain-containing protein [Actinobacteria bacterium]|nr:DUF305 domain-containing protein [Actinomycetota bacterium]